MMFINVKKMLFLLVLCNLSSYLPAQFQGIIEFRKINPDTTVYKYFIRGRKVRIEEFGREGSLKGIMLVDLDKTTVTALNTERKLYMDVTNTRGTKRFTPKIEKTGIKKTILGYPCTKWTVTDPDDNSKTEYWVGGNDFDFFKPLLKTLNRKDNLPVYFLKIQDNEHLFPFVGISYGNDGKQVMKLEATHVEPRTLRSSLFSIPKGYTKFEN